MLYLLLVLLNSKDILFGIPNQCLNNLKRFLFKCFEGDFSDNPSAPVRSAPTTPFCPHCQ